jgi:hypothetical protein
MDTRKATSEEWDRYYAETAPRGRHGKNDPIQRQRARALVRERLGIALGLAALAATLVAAFGLLAG